jgi:hypothetical protein
MWVQAGGGYWPRLCFDAVVMIVAVIGLVATAPWARFRQVHWVTAGALLVVVLVFAGLLVDSLPHADRQATADDTGRPRVLEPQEFERARPAGR